MARKNITGISFCGWELETKEELAVKKWLADKRISAKHFMRFLIRQHIKKEKLLNNEK